MDLFRKKMRANPSGTLAMIEDMNLPAKHLFLGGTSFKRIEIPSEINEQLKPWYTAREMYIGKFDPHREWAFSNRILTEVRKDFRAIAPLYQYLRGCADELNTESL